MREPGVAPCSSDNLRSNQFSHWANIIGPLYSVEKKKKNGPRLKPVAGVENDLYGSIPVDWWKERKETKRNKKKWKEKSEPKHW